MSVNFESTQQFSATVTKVEVGPEGAALITIGNTDANGSPVSSVTMSVPVTAETNVTHQRTGDTGIAPSQDLLDAIAALNTAAAALLDAVATNAKHAL